MLELSFVPMNTRHLDAMETWTYGQFFPDFDMRAYRAGDPDASPLKGPGGCDGYAVVDGRGELVGLFEYYFDAHGDASIGLALRPDLTGRGIGREFLEAGIRFLIDHYGYSRPHVQLTVAEQNRPAIRLYERAGFELVDEVDDGVERELRMRRLISPIG
jgi:[ribosomal protein S18]-alanine N-acetyltransferase